MRPRAWTLLIVVLAALFLAPPLVHFATESWWYESVGYPQVYTRTLTVSLLMFGLMGGGMLGILLLNLAIVRLVRPRDGVWIGGNVFDMTRAPLVQKFTDRTFLAVALFLSFLSGVGATGRWMDWLYFQHGGKFGAPGGVPLDPIFGNDAGFYIFQLPFLQYLAGWLQFVLIICLGMSVALHLYHRSIQFFARRVSFMSGARRHLLCLLALLALVKAWDYRLFAYGLLLSQHNLMVGAGYTDVNALRPVLLILQWIAVATAVGLLVNAFVRGWKLSAVMVLILVAVSLIGQGVVPTLVQRLSVVPNELEKEQEYLRHAIHNTRFAYGLLDMESREFAADENLSAQAVSANRLTVDNIRLWDSQQLLDTYGQLQELRTYYRFVDVDNDRYEIDGRLVQTSLSPRELDVSRLPSRTWLNEHLTYTHGFGVCMGPVARITSKGLPEFFVKDIPPTTTEKPLEVKQPRIYFGEHRGAGYVFTHTEAKELDYPDGEKNAYNEYDGLGGVVMDGWLRKFAYFLYFGEPKILLSTDIKAGSRVLYHRVVSEMARRVTPMVTYDDDPYMVVVDGRLVWILDGYLTTDRMPYAARTSVVNGSVNYIRNSVKTVIDAYDGSVRVFVVDPSEPMVAAAAAAFPGVFQPVDALEPALRAHLRYPQTLFQVQARILGTYHMEDTQVFYNKEDVWVLPQASDDREDIAYYTITRLPGAAREEFILMAPFVPARKQNMVAWMAARCDGPSYGKLAVFRLPKQKLVYGPDQIRALINQDSRISQQITLWNQSGSKVQFGSLLVIPIEESLIYVQPLYLASTGRGEGGQSALPELKRVIVVQGNRIAMEETLDASLAAVFGKEVGRAPAPAPPTAGPPPQKPETPEKPPAEWVRLSREAREHLERAERAQRAGDWAAYGTELKR
ncbi:MAG: UPF0182 family protein, partial [Armatimonadetes bacterium]|nr:UPF0182 family protein [Armatimonadota bacterium]